MTLLGVKELIFASKYACRVPRGSLGSLGLARFAMDPCAFFRVKVAILTATLYGFF